MLQNRRMLKFTVLANPLPLTVFNLPIKECHDCADPNIFGQFGSKTGAEAAGFVPFSAALLGRRVSRGLQLSIQQPLRCERSTRGSLHSTDVVPLCGSGSRLPLALPQALVFCLDAQVSLSLHCVAWCPRIKDTRRARERVGGKKERNL